MKKFLISAAFIAAFGAYALYANSTINATPVSVSDVQTTQVSKSSASSVSVSTGSASPNPSPVIKPVASPVTTPAAPKGQYTNGTYAGSVVDAYYGNIQVEAIISGGKLTDVKFLQYPNDRTTSVAINQRAMPVLRSEAIQAQSANVNGVSGASDSSAAFNESLASALAQAKA